MGAMLAVFSFDEARGGSKTAIECPRPRTTSAPCFLLAGNALHELHLTLPTLPARRALFPRPAPVSSLRRRRHHSARLLVLHRCFLLPADLHRPLLVLSGPHAEPEGDLRRAGMSRPFLAFLRPRRDVDGALPADPSTVIPTPRRVQAVRREPRCSRPSPSKAKAGQLPPTLASNLSLFLTY